MRNALQKAHQENQGLKMEISHMCRMHSTEISAVQNASEEESRSARLETQTLRSEVERYKTSLQAVSASAHHYVMAERQYSWERTSMAVQSLSQQAQAVIKEVEAKSDAAIAERDHFRSVAAQAEEHAEATRRWAESAIAYTQARSWEFALQVQEKLRVTEALLETRQTELLVSAQEMAEFEIEKHVEEVVKELEGQMNEAMDEVDESLRNAQDWFTKSQEATSLQEHDTQELWNEVSRLIRENRALRKRVERRDARLDAGRVARAVQESPPVAFKLKGRGGVIPVTVRNLVRELVLLGLKVHQVSSVFHTVGNALGVPIEGSISKCSIGRCMMELWVAGKMQVAERVHQSNGKGTY